MRPISGGVGGDRGAALLLVVLIIALLAVLVTEFQRSARLEVLAARNMRDSVQIHALAVTGREVAQVLLLEDLNDPAQASYDGRDEFWNQVGLAVPIGDPSGRFQATVERLEDLDGKFPLGALVDANGGLNDKVADAYFRFLGALDQHLKTADPPVDILEQVDHQDLLDALVDWMDEDELGAFEDNLDFTVPNVRITHLEDLQRVEGYDFVPEGFTHTIADAILPYVDTRHDPAVNMNTAQVPVLVATHPDIDFADAEELFVELEDAPETTKFDPKRHSSISGIQPSLFDLPHKIVSERFHVRVRVTVGDVVNFVEHSSEVILVRDRKEQQVSFEQWREGWLPDLWRTNAYVDPPVSLGFPGFPGGF